MITLVIKFGIMPRVTHLSFNGMKYILDVVADTQIIQRVNAFISRSCDKTIYFIAHYNEKLEHRSDFEFKWAYPAIHFSAIVIKISNQQF